MLTNRGLGRGLSSLIPNKQKKDNTVKTTPVAEQILFIDPTEISTNPYQPRTKFEKDKLAQLADSIRVHGILNPLMATLQQDGKYQLISGERRLRAALDLGLKRVPVILRAALDLEKLELALIENVQREDLNHIELARGYQRLIDEFSLTQEDLAKKIGKSRPQIANTLRLLSLPQEIQDSIRAGEISEGHAKVVLSLSNKTSQLNLWKKITLNKLTVRASEQESRHIKVKGHARKLRVRDADLVALEEELEQKLGTKAFIKGSLTKGQILIDYFSKEELEGIVNSF
jgi:ParB family chromosome partitioning protein